MPQRPPPRSQSVSAAVLAVLVKAATAYADDLASGLADATYDDRADLDGVRAAVEIVAPMPRTPGERRAAKDAGYRASSYRGSWGVYTPSGAVLTLSAPSQREAFDLAARHMLGVPTSGEPY